MIPRSRDYVEYCRENARMLRDSQDLALRGRNKQELTRQIQERIIAATELSSGDDLVDIGCGDGTLLRLALRLNVKSAIGFLATEEEVAIVTRLGLDVRQALTDHLPLPDQSASVIVCNSVLLVVPRERIAASLQEISRIARPEARVFLGEIPLVAGPPPEPEFDNARQTLGYLYRKHGLRTYLGMLRRMAYWKMTGQPILIREGTEVSFFAQPPEFTAMAEAAGLHLVRYWRHEDPPTRYNYLFRK
jgi:SAM-dependent methyltransferase